MKRILTLLLALVLILSLSACGKQETSSDASNAAGQTGTNIESNATGNSANGTASKSDSTTTEDGSGATSSKEQTSQTSSVATSKPAATQSKPQESATQSKPQESATQSKPQESATQSKPSGTHDNVGVTASQAQPNGTNSESPDSNRRNPKNIEFEAEYVSNNYSVYDENNICAPGVQFYDYGNGEYFCVILTAMFTSEPEDDVKQRTPVMYKGKQYYRCGAGQSPAPATFSDKDITLDYEGVTIKLILTEDGKIRVVDSQSSKLRAGTIMAIEWNMLK